MTFSEATRIVVPAANTSLKPRIANFISDWTGLDDALGSERADIIRDTKAAVALSLPESESEANQRLRLTGLALAHADHDGLAATPAILRNGDFVNRFLDLLDHDRTLSERTVGNYRRSLRAVARVDAVDLDPVRVSTLLQPTAYLNKDIRAGLAAAKRADRAPSKRALQGLWLLGASGALIRSGALEIGPDDVAVVDDTVQIRRYDGGTGNHRWIRIDQTWGAQLLDLAADCAAHGDHFILGGLGLRKTRYADLCHRFHRLTGTAIDLMRLRDRGVLGLVDGGAPLSDVLLLTGLKHAVTLAPIFAANRRAANGRAIR